MAIVGAVLAAALLVVVAVFQQSSALEGTPGGEKIEHLTPPAAGDPTAMQGKLLVRIGMVSGGGGAFLQNLPTEGVGPIDRYRNITARAALVGGEDEAGNLRELRDDLRGLEEGTPTGLAPAALEELLSDVELTLGVYEDADVRLDESQGRGLVERHGFFGRLVGVQNEPRSSAEWQGVMRGGEWLLVVLMVALGWVALLFVGGLVCATLAVMAMARASPWTFRRPTPGGSVHVETLCVFVLAFVGLKVAAGLAGLGTMAHLAAQWLLLATVFWPLLRGVSWGEFSRQTGWNTGRGVWREVGAGIFGYLATMPIFFAGVVVALLGLLLHTLLRGSPGEGADLPQNPVQELIVGSSGWELVMLFVLATVWAPIVEESIFRGALFRHLRGYLGLVASVVLSALAFGLMHGYAWFLLSPVIALGAGFALMREWRGSLIASMTAHALHNGVVLTFALTLFGLLKD